MASFEDREKGFERKFAHDEELKFKATARRNRLLGLWAAGQMGLSGDDAQNYAREGLNPTPNGPPRPNSRTRSPSASP